MPNHNVLLVLTDQHRYDIVGANGSPICRSPSLDALAQSGVNFSNAYSMCGLCSPARASIYTGVLPHRHGIVRNVMERSANPMSIPEDIPTLAERLRAVGCRSHFIGKWHAGARLPTQAGFTGIDVPGYGVAREHPDYLRYLRERGLDIPRAEPVGVGWAHCLALAARMTGPVEASVPCYLAERAIEFLRGQGSDRDPFFLALNFWGPHAPYLPCEPYASMYDPESIPPWPNFDDPLEDKPPIYRRYRDAFIGEGNPPRPWEECARWAALYFGFATQIDAQIGRVLSALEENGLADNTAVLFSCDHGDLTGAHGGMHDKGGILCQEVYHIPLMGRAPGGAQGRACDLPATNMDLSRTILECAGCDAPDDLDGRSLLPILRGDSVPDWPDYAAAEFFGHHYAYEARMIVHNGFKYIFHPSAFDELYDLRDDPWETRNLIASRRHGNILRACRRRLIDWAKQTGDELCVLCGLFHERLRGGAAPYTPDSMDSLRESPTRLIGE